MTSNVLPTNYKMKMEYRDMKIEVAGDKRFVEEKFYQLVTAVNKLARQSREAGASLGDQPMDVGELMPRPEADDAIMLDAGVEAGEEKEDMSSKQPPKRAERLPRDEGNEMLEYLYEEEPGSQVDTVLVMALYLDEKKGLDEISVRDIHDFYRQTHDSVPKNLSVSLQQNVNKGYLTREGNRKDGVRYSLTEEGVQYVRNGYTSEG